MPLSRIAARVDELKRRAEFAALQIIKLENDQRIFERGQCTDGQSISSRRKARNPREGDYSRGHGRRRQASGRQTGYVDLELTGRHRRSLIVGETDRGHAYGFSNERQRKIGEGHETYRQKRIYGPSDETIDKARRAAVEEARRFLRELIR